MDDVSDDNSEPGVALAATGRAGDKNARRRLSDDSVDDAATTQSDPAGAVAAVDAVADDSPPVDAQAPKSPAEQQTGRGKKGKKPATPKNSPSVGSKKRKSIESSTTATRRESSASKKAPVTKKKPLKQAPATTDQENVDPNAKTSPVGKSTKASVKPKAKPASSNKKAAPLKTAAPGAKEKKTGPGPAKKAKKTGVAPTSAQRPQKNASSASRKADPKKQTLLKSKKPPPAQEKKTAGVKRKHTDSRKGRKGGPEENSELSSDLCSAADPLESDSESEAYSSSKVAKGDSPSSVPKSNARASRYLAFGSGDADLAADVHHAVSALGVYSVWERDNDSGNAFDVLVLGETPRRTARVLEAIAGGKPVLSSSWIHESISAGRWLPYDKFESVSFREGCQRSQELHQGKAKGLLYGVRVGIRGTMKMKDKDLIRLVRLCDGRVATSRCDVVLQGTPDTSRQGSEDSAGTVAVTENWLLDSVETYRLLDKAPYSVSV